MKGKWATGIAPRNFCWIIKDQLAVSERPGGYSRAHRPIRRQEEIIWIREQGFSRVVSLLASPHNLHAYDELGVSWEHVPFGLHDSARDVLVTLYPKLQAWLGSGQKILVHQEELSDKVLGSAAGYLVFAGLVREQAQAISILEQISQRQLGPPGRQLVALAGELVEPPA